MEAKSSEQSEEKRDDAEAETLSLSKWHGKTHYNRTSHQSLAALKSAISYRYGWTCRQYRSSVITSSGMAAISTVLHNILIECQFSADKLNVIFGDELYEDTPALIHYLQQTYRCRFDIHSVDVTDTQSMVKLFHSDGVKGKTNILLIETCSNPSGYILDFSIVPTLHSLSGHLYVVMDNTWCSSLIFNPFDHCQSVAKASSSKASEPTLSSDSDKLSDSDGPLTVIAVTSLTKYYSGGSCIGGAIISDDRAFMKAVDRWMVVHGHHVSPVHCQLVLDNMDLMEQRIPKTSATTINVARFLEEFEDDMVVEVRYPLLESHVSCRVATKYWTPKGYGPSVLHFKIALGIKTEDGAWECLTQWEREGKGFPLKTSYGGRDTRFELMDDVVDENGVWVRLAIGFDDAEKDIIDTLKSLFDSLK